MSSAKMFQAWLDRFIPPIDDEGTGKEMKASGDVQITPSTPIPTRSGGEIFMPEKHVKVTDVNKKKKAELATAYFAMKTWIEELWAVEFALDGTPAPKEVKFYTQVEFKELNIPPRMRGAYGKISELYFTTYGRVIAKAKAAIAGLKQGEDVQDAEPAPAMEPTVPEPASVAETATPAEPEAATETAHSDEDDELGSTVVTEESGIDAVTKVTTNAEEVEPTTSEPAETQTETESEESNEEISMPTVLQQQAEPLERLEVAQPQTNSPESPLEWTRTSEINKDRAFIGAAVAQSSSNRNVVQSESDEPEESEWSSESVESPSEGLTTPAVEGFDFELLFGNGVVNMVAAMLASMSNFDNGLEGIILKVLDGVDATRDATVLLPAIDLGGSNARVHIHRTSKFGTYVVAASDGDVRVRFTLAVEDATQPEAEDVDK